jgi:DNA primase
MTWEKSSSPGGVVFSHLNKIFWPDEKYTKGDVIECYREMAPVILSLLLHTRYRTLGCQGGQSAVQPALRDCQRVGRSIL